MLGKVSRSFVTGFIVFLLAIPLVIATLPKAN